MGGLSFGVILMPVLCFGIMMCSSIVLMLNLLCLIIMMCSSIVLMLNLLCLIIMMCSSITLMLNLLWLGIVCKFTWTCGFVRFYSLFACFYKRKYMCNKNSSISVAAAEQLINS